MKVLDSHFNIVRMENRISNLAQRYDSIKKTSFGGVPIKDMKVGDQLDLLMQTVDFPDTNLENELNSMPEIVNVVKEFSSKM